MHTEGEARRLATLWNLTWKESSLSCAVYRTPDGLRLTIESPTAVIVTERFDIQPRAVSRAEALRDSLVRRGWTVPGPNSAGT